MKRRESSLVTGFFVLMLVVLIGAGLMPGPPGTEPVVPTGTERYVSDAQFAQYLEYRARLERSGMIANHCGEEPLAVNHVRVGAADRSPYGRANRDGADRE